MKFTDLKHEREKNNIKSDYHENLPDEEEGGKKKKKKRKNKKKKKSGEDESVVPDESE